MVNKIDSILRDEMEEKMPRFKAVEKDEAIANMPSKRAPKEQYIQYIKEMEETGAGVLELLDGESPQTEMNRLKSAAKSQGVELEIRRRGTTITFWAP